MRKILVVGLVIALIVSLFFMLNIENGRRRFFIESFGWKVSLFPISKEKVTIPTRYDLIYEEYNTLQLEAALNLEDYQGKEAMRYTYLVKNYPYENSGEIYANVLVYDKLIVAGDICDPAINGFMHSLVFLAR